MQEVNLTLVSYNISFGDASFSAPDRIHHSQEAPNLIRQECLAQSPHIIALQECPSQSFGSTLFGSANYVSLGTTIASHVHGYIDLLVHKDLVMNAQRITLSHPALPLPAIASQITLSNNTSILIASLHLPHTAEGAPQRELMCESIMQILSQQRTNNIILIGDFNMRENAENLVGGGWIDLWKRTCGAKDKTKKYTWDSRTNKFHQDGFGFIARFDRRYMRGSELSARSFDLFANTSVSGMEGDFLSDHFGIVAEIGVKASSSQPASKAD